MCSTTTSDKDSSVRMLAKFQPEWPCHVVKRWLVHADKAECPKFVLSNDQSVGLDVNTSPLGLHTHSLSIPA